MTKEAPAVLGRKGVKGRGYRAQKVLQRASGGLAQMGFEFGERQFDRIQIRAVGRKVAHFCPASGEEALDTGDLVGGEVIQDQCVTRTQLGAEHVLQVSGEGVGVNRPFDQKGSGHTLMAQGGEEGGALPMTVRQGGQAAPTNGTAPVVPCHLGVEAGFIKEHQPAHVPSWLLFSPPPPGRSDVRPILLGGARRFFYSSDPAAPADATAR